MDRDAKTTFGDPQLKYQFTRVDKLPKAARALIISIIEALIRRGRLGRVRVSALSPTGLQPLLFLHLFLVRLNQLPDQAVVALPGVLQ